jgi:hypothetical protein
MTKEAIQCVGATQANAVHFSAARGHLDLLQKILHKADELDGETVWGPMLEQQNNLARPRKSFAQAVLLTCKL